MDKQTVLAVVLSVVIITASFVIQAIFFPTTMQQARRASPAAETGQTEPAAQAVQIPAAVLEPAPAAEELAAADVVVTTDVFEATFSTKGAVLTSLKLKAFKERDGSPVEMVLAGDTGLYPFRLYLEDYDTGGDVFRREPSVLEDRVEFSRQYVWREGGREVPFVLKKSFRFHKGDYMMEFRVSLETPGRERLPIEAYRFFFGPQIGPHFARLDNQREYRHLIYYADGKRRDFTGKVKQGYLAIPERPSWAAIEGKYFLVSAVSYVPDPAACEVGFDASPLSGLPERKQASLTFRRLLGRNASVEEGYKFFVGPKKHEILASYNDRERNPWRESGLRLEQAVTPSFWGWLSNALKWLLELFYRIIPNWGVAIIMLTIFTKIVFWPLTHKSFQSTSKMQALAPKLAEIRERYKDHPERMNQEMAALYKREGVNPLGGCLPLLLQMPIFFALYYLFNNYFELRGAAFISPWISDLSAPEQFLTLPFSLPLLGDQLNLLPFLMLGMTFLQQWVTQTPGTQSAGQNKLLLYGMPLFFFFIMYNMPSGLLLYWSVQSLISFVQQFYVNQLRAKSPSGRGDKR